jgi:peptidoglycan/xylan/chitin deacetylase (PgdA/CDA1 family)
MNNVLILFFYFFLSGSVWAQKSQPWKGKSCAVVLTYDDALNMHLDHAIPALDSLGLKGTFYLTGYSGAIDKRIPEWRKAAAKGHELGNHTLYHPCAGGPGRSFVTPETDLRNYTVTRMINEMRMNNTLLKSIDGKTHRTFAYPCGDTRIGDTAYIDKMKGDFTGARGVRSEMPPITGIDLFNVPCYMINGQTGEELIALVKQAMADQRLLVFLFHGVGGEHSLNVSLEAHRKLLYFLKQNEKAVWIASMTEVATYIKDYNEKLKNKAVESN